QAFEFFGFLRMLRDFALELLALAVHRIEVGGDREERDHATNDAQQVFLDDIHNTLVANLWLTTVTVLPARFAGLGEARGVGGRSAPAPPPSPPSLRASIRRSRGR